jgi:hypothetical protein
LRKEAEAAEFNLSPQLISRGRPEDTRDVMTFRAPTPINTSSC